MYYILGINHYIQYVNKEIHLDLFTEFVQFVSEIVEDKDIAVIAEEFNEDCLVLNHVQRSVLQLISEEASVGHLFIDPTQSVRTALGIPNPQTDESLTAAYQVRERYWLDQIALHHDKNILICIGASHVKSFTTLLEHEGRAYQMIDPYWREELFHQRNRLKETSLKLKNHADLKNELEKILLESPLICEVLSRTRALDLKDYYVGAGCICQTVWNHLYDMPLNYGIKDIDLVYFDKDHTDYDSENAVAHQAMKKMADLGFELDVKNQARVHLWYHEKFGKPIEPYTSLEEAIKTWPTTATAIGVRLNEDGSMAVYAPFGLEDLFEGILRANKKLITKEVFDTKTQSWQKKWPLLKVIDWDSAKA